MSTPLPPPDGKPSGWEPIKGGGRSRPPTWVLIGSGLLVAGIVGNAISSSRKDDPAPAKPARELCEIIRDHDNDNLTAGDLADMADMSKGALRQYVYVHCPDQLVRVS